MFKKSLLYNVRVMKYGGGGAALLLTVYELISDYCSDHYVRYLSQYPNTVGVRVTMYDF
jgi:hypothetical protein